MALDQVHEQNNTLIKGIGGASHLLNHSDESPLLRWELCEDNTPSIPSLKNKHHEDNSSFRERFNEDVKRVFAAFSDNPFLLDAITLTAINNKKNYVRRRGSCKH